MVAYFELGEVLKERKQWGPMIKHYRSFTKRFKRVDAGYVIRAYTLLGNAYVNLPSKYRNHKKAKEAYQSAIKAYKPISKTDVKDIPYETMTAVAESMFKLANYDFQEVRKIPFMKVKKTRDAKKHIGQLKKNITKLIKELNRVKSNFEKILPLNVSDWGLAALTQIGEMYNFTASNLENAPAPSIFDEETKEFFRNKTIEQSAPFRQLAIQSYQECLKQSLKIQWFNKWSDLAEKQVAKLDPSRFRYNIEERGKPTHFHNNRIQRQLVLTLPEDEVDE